MQDICISFSDGRWNCKRKKFEMKSDVKEKLMKVGVGLNLINFSYMLL